MTVLTEGRHAAEFILSEASGMRSREAFNIGADQTLVPGAILGGPIAATSDVPEHYVEYNPANSPSGSNVVAGLLIYRTTTGADEQVKVAGIARDAEVNINMIGYKSGMNDAQKLAARTALRALGIIPR